MVQCRRLGYAVISTEKMEEQAQYYTEVIGLFLSYQDDSRMVLSSKQGLECVVLERGERAKLTALSFEISPHLSLEDAKRSLEQAGIAADIRSGRARCAERVVSLKDPYGTEIELFNSVGFSHSDLNERGVGALKLGHVARFVPDVDELTEFYERVLGFRRSDWREGRAMFLRCNSDHHTINFFRGEKKLAHLAFEVKDFSELVRASDYLVRRNYPLDWGPGRHTIGHNCACYHSNSDGLRIELYTEMDQMKDEELGYFDPRPWHEDRPQRPRNWDLDNSPRNKWIPGVP